VMVGDKTRGLMRTCIDSEEEALVSRVLYPFSRPTLPLCRVDRHIKSVTFSPCPPLQRSATFESETSRKASESEHPNRKVLDFRLCLPGGGRSIFPATALFCAGWQPALMKNGRMLSYRFAICAPMNSCERWFGGGRS